MKLFLESTSSLALWLTLPLRPTVDQAVGLKALDGCNPTMSSVLHASQTFPFLRLPIEVSTAPHSRPSLPLANSHCISYSFGERVYYPIAGEVHASSPELCFVQLARSLSLLPLIKAGYALCGSFYFNPCAQLALSERPPLTTPKRIEAFINRNPRLPGNVLARKALPHLARKAASPPEIFLHLLLSLPFRYGGYQLPDLCLNTRIRPSKKAQAIAGRSYLVPDICHTERRLAIEYDSNAEHMTPMQITRDAAKRLALEADGYKVITVTARQLVSPEKMHHIAREVAGHLGVRLRTQSEQFAPRQRELFKMGWSFDSYLRFPEHF